MTSMFKSCNRLTSIDLSQFDTSNVVDMQSMFYGCSSLKYLDLSNFNTSKVKSINKMFEVCNSLIYLNLKYFKLDHSVTKDKTFNSISTYVTYCIEDQKTKEYLGINSNCSNDYFKDNIIIDFENKKCTVIVQNIYIIIYVTKNVQKIHIPYFAMKIIVKIM